MDTLGDEHCLLLSTEELFALGEFVALGKQTRDRAAAMSAMKKLLALMFEHAERSSERQPL